MKHRTEIDGLRALAVLPVMIFHAAPALLPGGYLGVDIFFVISGFLITRIIADALADGRFSIVDFYERRARRILPALGAVMLICTPIAWALMIPDDLENYGQSLVATALSANNVLLYLTVDYFALETQFKPLMHTWSLGVEEQYYFAIPFVMLLAHRLDGRRAVVAVIAGTTLASFAASLFLAQRDPTANFYLISSRAWELGAGALTTLAAGRLAAVRRGLSAALALAGLALVMLPFFLFDDRMPVPGLPTLIPVLGTCMILAFAAQHNAAGRLLSAPPLVLIGLVSYSAYLWHQPVFVFVRIASLERPATTTMLALIPIVLAIAWLSWRFVEAPFRDRAKFSRRAIFLLSGALLTTTVAAGMVLHLTSGFHAAWPELASGDPDFGARQNIAYNSRPYRYADRPFSPNAAQPKMLVIGDSYARDFINMAEESGVLAGKAVSYSDLDTCDTPMPPALRARVRAADIVVWAVLKMGDPEILACTPQRLREFATLGDARVFVIGTKNFGWNNNAVMLLPADRRYSYQVRPLEDVVRDNRAAEWVVPRELYVDVLGALGDAQGRVPVFTPDRKFISQDRRHLTKAGARYVGAVLFGRAPLDTLRTTPR